jgi:hypothetical protein
MRCLISRLRHSVTINVFLSFFVPSHRDSGNAVRGHDQLPVPVPVQQVALGVHGRCLQGRDSDLGREGGLRADIAAVAACGEEDDRGHRPKARFGMKAGGNQFAQLFLFSFDGFELFGGGTNFVNGDELPLWWVATV